MFSKDLAYWVGVVQTDGYFKRQHIKKQNIIRYFISLTTHSSSLPMLKKFQKLSQNIFKIKGSTYYDKKRKATTYHFGAKNLIPLFQKLKIDFSDPPKPPLWIINNKEFFGAYSAGIIDGDGDIRVKRPKYPQCSIRINSGKKQEELARAIKDILNIGGSFSINPGTRTIENRTIFGTSHRLEFYVSSKNYQFFQDYVIPHISLEYKKQKIKEFVEKRAVGGNRTPSSS